MIEVKRKAPTKPPILNIKVPCLIYNKDVLNIRKANNHDYEVSVSDDGVFNCIVVSKKTLAELGTLLIELSKQ